MPTKCGTLLCTVKVFVDMLSILNSFLDNTTKVNIFVFVQVVHVLTFKCQNDLAPQYLTSKFTKRSNMHTRNTRTRDSLQSLLYRTAIGQRTFSYRGAYIWNNLHNELRQSASLAPFKCALKDTLLRQTFPS